MKATAAASSTGRRPRVSAQVPAKNAPTAQPKSIEATFMPVPMSSEPKASRRASIVPLITPLSKPNRKPPRAATAEIPSSRNVLPSE